MAIIGKLAHFGSNPKPDHFAASAINREGEEYQSLRQKTIGKKNCNKSSTEIVLMGSRSRKSRHRYSSPEPSTSTAATSFSEEELDSSSKSRKRRGDKDRDPEEKRRSKKSRSDGEKSKKKKKSRRERERERGINEGKGERRDMIRGMRASGSDSEPESLESVVRFILKESPAVAGDLEQVFLYKLLKLSIWCC